MRERDIERKLKVEVERIGGLCLKFTSSVSGIPDRLVLYDGKLIFVELKAPGNRPRPLQMVWIRRLRNLGFRVEIIDDGKQIRELVEELRNAG